MNAQRRSLRDVASWLLPPVAVEGIARVARRQRHFHGPISTWSSGATYGAGDAELAAASVLAVHANGLEDLLDLPRPTARALIALLWSLAHGPQDTPVRVVDFGGGPAPLYRLCRQVVPASVRIDWRVCDLPEIASRSQAAEELSWTSELESVPKPIHTVVTDACLQYIERPFDALRTLAALGAEHVIINRLPLFDGTPLIVSQTLVRSGRSIEFPMHVLNRAEFDQVVGELGLNVIASWVCGPGYRIRYGVKAVDTYGFVLGA